MSMAVIIAVGLAVALLLPFLFTEIRVGKKRLGPLWKRSSGRMALGQPSPVGAGDNRPGVLGDPAPGQPDAQSDPYSPSAQREAPPVRS
jgi:hypothetical protein